MKNFVRSATLLLATGMLMFSCRQELDKQVQPSAAQAELSAVELDEYRTQFAKTLAKALVNEEVRSLVKKEAEKQFDKDYDVLFQLVKDTEVQTGVTLQQHLSGLSESEEAFRKVTETLPLLTILVPELNSFSVKNWDVTTQIPLVAVVNSNHNEKKHTKLIAFDHEGNRFELASNVEPTRPVIVVKDNERVIVAGKNDKNGRSGFSPVNGSMLLQDKTNRFYFMDDAFNKEKEDATKRAGRFAGTSNVDVRVREAYNLKAPVQRDYIYYNILNSADQGTLNYNYTEYITFISPTSSGSISNANDDAGSDWADGGLEFSIDILRFNGPTTLFNTNRMIPVAVSEFRTSSGELSGYKLPYPISLGPWNMQTQGDTWQFIVQEWDPIGEYTETVSSQTKIALNFKNVMEADVLKIFKVGLEFGASQETTHSASTTRKTSTGSDQLGKAEVYYRQPVILSRACPGGLCIGYNMFEINTGAYRLGVETGHINQPNQ